MWFWISVPEFDWQPEIFYAPYSYLVRFCLSVPPYLEGHDEGHDPVSAFMWWTVNDMHVIYSTFNFKCSFMINSRISVHEYVYTLRFITLKSEPNVIIILWSYLAISTLTGTNHFRLQWNLAGVSLGTGFVVNEHGMSLSFDMKDQLGSSLARIRSDFGWVKAK